MATDQFIQVTNINDFTAKSKAVKEKIMSLVGGEWSMDLWNIAEDAKGMLVDETPKKTGKTAKGWRVSRARTGKSLNLGVVVHNSYEDDDPPILKYLEFGTKPHEIKPIAVGGVLTFKTKSGNWVSTKKVNHPGNPPYAMVSRTREKYQMQFDRIADMWSHQLERIWEGK